VSASRLDPAAARASRAWLVVLLVVLGGPQLSFALAATDIGVDGGYYLDVAMHVRDGLGLVSDVSLYHAGFPHFPHPTPIYPLWPLLLGHLGRLVDIIWLSHWLPTLLWFLALCGGWHFGKRLLPGSLMGEAPVRRMGLHGLHGGHLALIVLGTQRELSRFSTMPYTEGLAFALFALMLWRLTLMRPRLRDGLELGTWLALLCLCRSQFLVAPVAVAGALGFVGLLGGREGRRWLAPGAAALGVVGLALLLWWLHIRTFLPGASPLVLLRFDQAQVSDLLSPVDVIKDTHGLGDFVLDRLDGVALAWSPFHWNRSYARGFHTLQWALPLAVLVGLPALWRLRGRLWITARQASSRPDALLWATLLLLSLGALASVHLPHKEGFGSWYFHRRHAAICLLPFGLALGWLVVHRARGARLGALAIVLSLGGFWVESQYWRQQDAWAPERRSREARLARWLQARASADAPLVVALTAFSPPDLAWRTDHVGYHWFYARTSADDVEAMFDVLGADLLVFYKRPLQSKVPIEEWAARADVERFEAGWVRVDKAPRAFEVYRRAPRP